MSPDGLCGFRDRARDGIGTREADRRVAEPYLAAGQGPCQEAADPAKWLTGYDPMKVMWAQAADPDNSEIWMTFQTDRQFPQLGKKTFPVHFQRGRAVKTQMLGD